jgi:hypothetical protein
MQKRALFVLILLFNTFAVFAQETEENNRLHFIPMASYNYIGLENQSAHIPGIGFGLMKGDYGKDFTEIHRSLFGVALYQPVFFSNAGTNETYHQIDVLLDGRIERHEIFGIFRSASDKPVAGGLQTFQTGVGYGYEIIRNSSVSLILGAGIAVGDFGLSLPDGSLFPILPLPVIRFGLNSKWVDLTFDFLTGPNMAFTIAPEKRIRFTADMRMDYYRSIEDVICEYLLWYRFFDNNSRLGDFMGVGIGFKNDSLDFDLSTGRNKQSELQHSAIIGVIDFTVLRLEGGYIFDSRSLIDGEKLNSQGKGFYIAIQGLYRF